MYLGGPHRVLLRFTPPSSLILLNPEGNRGRTRKGIQFWIERFIRNSGGELGFIPRDSDSPHLGNSPEMFKK